MSERKQDPLKLPRLARDLFGTRIDARAESENGRFAMIENYKSELAQAKADKDIATIPVEFQIERTSYTATEGTVTVIEWFDYRTFREKKRFTYYLVSRDGIWRVVDYTVDNLGTE